MILMTALAGTDIENLGYMLKGIGQVIRQGVD